MPAKDEDKIKQAIIDQEQSLFAYQVAIEPLHTEGAENYFEKFVISDFAPDMSTNLDQGSNLTNDLFTMVLDEERFVEPVQQKPVKKRSRKTLKDQSSEDSTTEFARKKATFVDTYNINQVYKLFYSKDRSKTYDPSKVVQKQNGRHYVYDETEKKLINVVSDIAVEKKKRKIERRETLEPVKERNCQGKTKVFYPKGTKSVDAAVKTYQKEEVHTEKNGSKISYYVLGAQGEKIPVVTYSNVYASQKKAKKKKQYTPVYTSESIHLTHFGAYANHSSSQAQSQLVNQQQKRM